MNVFIFRMMFFASAYLTLAHFTQAAANDTRHDLVVSQISLSYISQEHDAALFIQAVREAVVRHPLVNAAIANHREARQARREVRAQLLPTLSLDFAGDASVARDFANGFDNIVARSRDAARADVVLRGEQLLFDGGAARARLQGALTCSPKKSSV
ncbi:MAG: TolC family protein [Pseudomonadota bacterium]